MAKNSRISPFLLIPIFIFLFFTLFLIGPNLIFAQESDHGLVTPLILGIEQDEDADPGAGVTLESSSGSQKTAKEEELLDVGDTIETDSKTAIRLGFEDGSEVVLSPDSKIKIDSLEDEEGNDVPLIELISGKIRSMIGEGIRKWRGSHKFFIKSKDAVMGVRGTDFITDVTSGETEVHTIEGTVDVSQDMASFKGNKRRALKKGFSTKAKKGRALGRGRKFNVQEKVERFKKRHPKMASLRNRIKRDRAGGRTRRSFKKARERFKDRVQRRRDHRENRRNKVRDRRGEGKDRRADQRENQRDRGGKRGENVRRRRSPGPTSLRGAKGKSRQAPRRAIQKRSRGGGQRRR